MTPEYQALREAVARTLCDEADFDPDTDWNLPSFLRKADAVIATVREALREPTPEMHDAARDWSAQKYGKPIGTDASEGCWRAMLPASALGGRRDD